MKYSYEELCSYDHRYCHRDRKDYDKETATLKKVAGMIVSKIKDGNPKPTSDFPTVHGYVEVSNYPFMHEMGLEKPFMLYLHIEDIAHNDTYSLPLNEEDSIFAFAWIFTNHHEMEKELYILYFHMFTILEYGYYESEIALEERYSEFLDYIKEAL